MQRTRQQSDKKNENVTRCEGKTTRISENGRPTLRRGRPSRASTRAPCVPWPPPPWPRVVYHEGRPRRGSAGYDLSPPAGHDTAARGQAVAACSVYI